MKLSRSARVGGIALVGALALAACGSDNNSGSSSTSTTTGGAAASSSSAVCGTIDGEGSTAQKNALDEAIADFTGQNSGAKVNYNATGSGAGIKSFNGGQVDWAGSDSALKTDPAAGASTSETATRRSAAAATRPGTSRSSPARSPSPTTSRRRQARAHAATRGADLPGEDHAVERPGHRQGELGRPAAQPEDHVFYRSDESGTTENFRSTSPARRRRTSRRAVEELVRNDGPGRREVGRRRAGHQEHRRWRRLRRVVERQGQSLGVAQIDNGGGAVELSAESAGKAVAAAQSRARATTCGSSSTTRRRRRGVPDRPRHLRDRLLEGPGRSKYRCSSPS